MRVNIQIPRSLQAAELALVREALQVLTDANLPDLAETLCRRALRPRDQLPRVLDVPAAGDAGQTTLTPICELLLRDLVWLAAVPGWPLEWRRARALEMLDLAGFPDQPKESTETP